MTDTDAMLRETYAVLRLQVLITEPAHSHRRREYLLRRAAVADRWADHPQDIRATRDAARDADLYAQELLDYDHAHGTSRGPLPPEAPAWHEHVRGYVRQEHAAWIADTQLEETTMDVWDDPTITDGMRHTLTVDGVTSETDPHYSQADATDLKAGRIDAVEYRRRYHQRYNADRGHPSR